MGLSATIVFKPSAAAMSGTAQRTMSQPASAKRLICSKVATGSLVFVFVMDCTAIGAVPPTFTLPTSS